MSQPRLSISHAQSRIRAGSGAEAICSDARSSIEFVRRDAESPLLAHRVCRALALGLLPVGVSRSGQWVSQLRFGPLSILCVWLDRRDRRLQSEHARFSGGLDFVGCEFLKLHWCASPICYLAIWPRRPAWGAFGGLRRLIAAKPRCAKGLQQPAQQPNSCLLRAKKISNWSHVLEVSPSV